MKTQIKIATLAASVALASSANATILTVFDGVTAGVASFDATVTGAGGTVAVDVWSGLVSGTSIDRGAYTITQNDGLTASVQNYGTLSGQTIDIGPALNLGETEPPGGRAAPEAYFDSGITFTFVDPVNSIGFEVGDWATCCQNPTTDLFISFDGGAPILVASADTSQDGLFPSQDPNVGVDVYEIFVAAFDDTDDFNQVSFWGNGLGEVLVAGGQVRYALLDQGTLPPDPNGVPVPAPIALLGLGLVGLALRKRQS